VNRPVVPPPPVVIFARCLTITERPPGRFRCVFLDNYGVSALLMLGADDPKPGIGQACEVLVGGRGWPESWRRV
jgi:hypothetical protein